ncbi:Fic family protein [Candidatus Peregrinibacteria bacterium]|nr:Fic family protein [Candidatus Peregrinibacteria bacterium]
MATAEFIRIRLKSIKTEYDLLKTDKKNLLQKIEEAEIPENVYNSNAIENSTLTMKETEKILFENKVPKNLSLREVFEAKNLARVSEYIQQNNGHRAINRDHILAIHQILISGIEDNIAGRFRTKGEYVRVAGHVTPGPEKIEELIADIINQYSENTPDSSEYFLDKIAKFHLEFERIHPFNDGNGRIGRAIINWQLQRLGFPSIIIRNKEKKYYYAAFGEYNAAQKSEIMEHVLAMALMESLHKRTAYLGNKNIITLANHAKKIKYSLSALINSARRQTIPAFREKGVWKISDDRPSYTRA